MIWSIISLVAVWWVTGSVAGVAQQHAGAPAQLPAPSGKYAVARIGYDWIDESRPESLSKISGTHREIVVCLWYPTAKGGKGKSAEYLPGIQSIVKSGNDQDLKRFWGSAWTVVASGHVESETFEKSPIAKTKESFPLIVFLPGLGISSTSYTTLIQEVVSHGYIVASIEPTYEVPAVAFPDGRVVPFLEEATGRHQPTLPGETREQFLKRMHAFDAPHFDKWAADVRFTIDQIASLNVKSESVSPISGRVKLNEIAAWGHSFGGRAAARACQIDARIKVCLNADGLGSDGPIFTYEGTALPRQPFLWMEVFHEPPTDAQLAPYKMTRKDWDKNHQAQAAINAQQLKACPGGSYHVSINLPGIEHFSFTDKPLLESDKKEDKDNAVRSLRVIEEFTIAFFDRNLKHRNGKWRDVTAAPPAGTAVEKFEPARQ